MRMLYALAPTLYWSKTFPESSDGIARAAIDDPLFPEREEGAELTACLLVAAAWAASRLHPYDHAGGRVGLFRLIPPRTLRAGQRMAPNLLILPRSASLVAIDL